MSDEVSQFLEQVERLRGQQIEEDEVRARELEEYLAAKRERQARREGECHKGRLFAKPHALLLHFLGLGGYAFLSCTVAGVAGYC